MTSIELKQELKNKIEKIDDIDFLRAIQTILNAADNHFIKLTEDQEEELLMAREEGRKGNYISQSEMDEKVKKWSKGK